VAANNTDKRVEIGWFFGAERLFTQVRKNPASAIMGDGDHTILLDNLLSIPRLGKDTGH
jgi:hypothetical protein